MQNYRTTSHSMYDLKYHLVWITKYRKKVLYGQVAERLRDLIREICKTKDIEIIKGSISKDHVHLFVSVPPYLPVSKLMQSLEGKTSYKLLSEYKDLSKLPHKEEAVSAGSSQPPIGSFKPTSFSWWVCAGFNVRDYNHHMQLRYCAKKLSSFPRPFYLRLPSFQGI